MASNIKVSKGYLCPLCNAATAVKCVREENGMYVRSRECYNEHKFKTAEMVITAPVKKRKYRRDKFS